MCSQCDNACEIFPSMHHLERVLLPITLRAKEESDTAWLDVW